MSGSSNTVQYRTPDGIRTGNARFNLHNSSLDATKSHSATPPGEPLRDQARGPVTQHPTTRSRTEKDAKARRSGERDASRYAARPALSQAALSACPTGLSLSGSPDLRPDQDGFGNAEHSRVGNAAGRAAGQPPCLVVVNVLQPSGSAR